MKATFIVLALVAAALGIITFVIVFYPSGPVATVAGRPTASQTSTISTSTASSTVASSAFSSTTPSLITSGGDNAPAVPGELRSQYSFPYPLTWNEGSAALSITGASFDGNHLTFELTVKTGAGPECIPMNMRLVKDEFGNLQSPDNSQFTLSDQNDCAGSPNISYEGQPVTFTISSDISAPFLFTTGGASNAFFQVATTTNGILITLPSRSG